jgi:hypothetical protein
LHDIGSGINGNTGFGVSGVSLRGALRVGRMCMGGPCDRAQVVDMRLTTEQLKLFSFFGAAREPMLQEGPDGYTYQW